MRSQQPRSLGADLAAVDLLHLSDGAPTVLELNGAADFDSTYSLPGENVYARIASALDLSPRPRKNAATVSRRWRPGSREDACVAVGHNDVSCCSPVGVDPIG